MTDLQGNGADNVLEYRGLAPIPRGSSSRAGLCPTVIVFLLVLLQLIARCHVLSSSCSYFGYYFDYMASPPVTFSCLKLTSNLTSEICDKQVTARHNMIRKSNIRLNFCSSYPLYSLISSSDHENPCRIDASIADCTSCLDRLLRIDQEIAQNISGFRDLLNRMDCNTNYSVKWNCTHCQIAYKEWLCATRLTYYHHPMDHPVPPCQDFCSHVEKTCPFFPPDNDDTHAGDPSFICKDPEIASQLSVYGQKPGCYNLCHITDGRQSENCHTIDLSSNKNVTVGNGTVASSASRSAQLHSCSSVIQCLLALWLVRTISQHTSIGLT